MKEELSTQAIKTASVVCDLKKLLDYASDHSNVWNPDKYVDRNVNGHIGKEVPNTEFMSRMKYVMGNAFITGSTSKGCFKIFYTSGGQCQLYIAKNSTLLAKMNRVTLSVPYYRLEEVLERVYNDLT